MRRGVNVWVVLAIAAFAGIIGGVVLANQRFDEEQARDEARMAALARPEVVGALRVPSADFDISAPDPASLEGLPVYPGSEPRNMVQLPNSDLSISWFHANESVASVVSFYEHSFDQSKIAYFTRYFGAERASVAWFERNPRRPDAGTELVTGRVHMATVMNENGQTLVLLSVSRPDRLLEAMEAPRTWYRPIEGAEARFVSLSSEGVRREMAFVGVNEATARASAEKVAAAYTAAGWSRVDDATGRDDEGERSTVMLSKGAESLLIEAAIRGSEKSVMLTYEDKGGT